MRSVLVWLMVLSGCITATAAPARGDVGVCRPAELFATDTADPLFEMQADTTIALNGATATGSTQLDGVYWSNALQQATYERSREFHLCSPDEPTLHNVAEALRHQFNQEAELTFDYLPQYVPGADAVVIHVPDVDIARFRDALVADQSASYRMRGGSVTITDHTLILVAAEDDMDVAQRLVGAAGGDWDKATVAHGKREFAD